MGKQQAIPSTPFEPQRPVKIIMGASPCLHPIVFHGIDDVSLAGKVRGASVLITFLVLQNLSHLTVAHKANDGRSFLATITTLGRKVVDEATLDLNSQVFEDVGLSEQDIADLRRVLAKLR